MHGNGIMDTGADTCGLQGGLCFVASGEGHRIDVVDVPAVRW